MQGRKHFFEKKKQKTFAGLARRGPMRGAIVIKVFCFFFSKKMLPVACFS